MQLLLPSQYLAPVGAYAYLFAAERVVEDRGEFYIKQTYRNRCYIAGPQGVLSLIVPVERKGLARLPMRDVRISEHGNWRHVHWTALVSAYESSPYFEYYADDFRPLYETPFRYLVDFNEALHQLVCELLSFATQERVSDEYVPATAGWTDLRQLLSPKQPLASLERFRSVDYYQVFASRLGFLPNLSIVDLLFNLGPEPPLILRNSFL